MQSPCEYEFSRGNGTGVAEAIGNWGFSNCSPSSNEGGIERMRCLFEEMKKLKTSKQPMKVKYNPLDDPGAWHVCPSPHECKPPWTFPDKRPLITFSSTVETIPVSSYLSVKQEMVNPIPGRKYLWDKTFTHKWYRVDGTRCCFPMSCHPAC
ncbi:uncharacterized protein LOC107035611 [Diachasma alloeum]|uniref:uncharacterized protein LOC107035611 n=1 Tax=Diachasma alloeum TaxID=454923 RepID=UPI0007381C26|nr:uncharacterized protein LOC107035611 [Diachasma alloeum]